MADPPNLGNESEPNAGRRTPVALILVLVLIVMLLGSVAGVVTRAYFARKELLGRRVFAEARLLAQRGQHERAIEFYRVALGLQPAKVDFRVALAEALVDSGRLTEAESYLRDVLGQDPTSGPANLMRARVAVRREEPELAADHYHRAVYGYWPQEDQSQRLVSRYELALVLLQLNERTQAVAEATQYAAEIADEVVPRMEAGHLLLRAGVPSAAAEQFRRAAELDRDNPAAYTSLGWAELQRRNFAAAQMAFSQAARRDPENQEVRQQWHLLNRVISIDPTLPRLGLQERLRRSRQLASAALQELTRCLEEDAPQQSSANGNAPQPVGEQAELIAEATKTLQARRRRDDDPEAFLTLAQRLWQARPQRCEAPSPAAASQEHRAMSLILNSGGSA
jgi:tetratricopeptide (TPR) repeat protein